MTAVTGTMGRMMIRMMSLRWLPFSLLCVTGMSCAPAISPAVDDGRDAAAVVEEPAVDSGAPAGMPVGRQGLAVRQWRVADPPPNVADVLARHARGAACDESTRQRLERNGLRLVRVPLPQLDALATDLGRLSRNVEGWHGQAYDWRGVIEAAIDPDGAAVAIDGRVRRLVDGRLRLLIRGWTLQMEHGPRLCLQLLPEYDRTAPTPLDLALGRRPFVGRRFTDLWTEILLEPGFGYVLLGLPPSLKSPGQSVEDEEQVVADETGDDERLDRAATIGPDAPPPLTLGEVLLRSGSSRTDHEVLIFVPLMPRGFYPPQEAGPVGEGAES